MDLIAALYLIIALVVALTLHEFAHAWAGDMLGDQTARNEGRLSLNPAAHIDPVMTVLLPLLLIVLHSPVIFGAAKPVPFNPWAVKYKEWGVAMVAAAGPAMNLLLAIIFAAILRIVPVNLELIPLLLALISVNIAFAVFNMLPIPPLDGSRVLYAISPGALREVLDKIEHAGLIVIFGILLIGSPLIMPIISGVTGALMQLLVPGLTASPFGTS